jgi:hypothetical protein
MSASAPLLDSATKLPALVQLPDQQITAEKRAFRRLAGACSASFVVGALPGDRIDAMRRAA